MFEDGIKKIKRVLGLNWAEGSIAVHPDDIFLVSYPRSGNTWMRFLIANLVFRDEEISFANLEEKVPDIHRHSKKYLQQIARPRMLKSHKIFDPRYRIVIYLVRDPRDICISYYYYHLKFHKIKEGYSLDKFVERFISGDLDPFGSWGEHVGSWLGARDGADQFLMIRYEDLMKDTKNVVSSAAAFLDIQVTQARLERAIQQSSFEKMQYLEKQQTHLWKSLRKSRRDIMFIRSGKTNIWEGEMSDESKELIERAWSHQMDRLGYYR